jgi:acetyl esterase/lipase
MAVKRIMWILIWTASAHGLFAQSLDPATAWATTASYNIRVFPDPGQQLLEQSGFVYYRATNIDLRASVITPGPETIVRPTVLFIHGGGWASYTKEQMIFRILPYLARGMDVVIVDYREANQAPAPAAVEDCRCALQWVFKHAMQFGFDTERVVVAGVSAGAHLALMTGMLDGHEGFDDACAYSIGTQPVKVAAIVDFFGITDVGQLLQPPNQRPWALEWFAGVPDRMDLARRVSPLTYVRPNLPPTVIVHGTADKTVPYAQSVRLHEALDKAGVANELISVPNGGHAVYPDNEKIRAQSEVFQFLSQHRILTTDH